MDKQLKNKIYGNYSSTFNEQYKTLQWKLDQVKGCFTKGEFEISCRPTAEYYNELVFQPMFTVKNEIIATILNQIFPDSALYNQVGWAQSKEMAQLMGIEWKSPYIDEYGNYQYKIYEDTDLIPIVNDHFLYMEQVGFPFFENFSSIEKIDTYINSKILKYTFQEFENEDTQKVLLKFFYGKRETFVGITSAYLVNNPSKNSLIERFRYLHNGNNYVLEDFEKLINHLNENYA